MSQSRLRRRKNANKQIFKDRWKDSLQISQLSLYSRIWSFLLFFSIVLSILFGYKVVNNSNFVGSIKVNLFGDNFKLEVVKEIEK
jgi:hypothetical protein